MIDLIIESPMTRIVMSILLLLFSGMWYKICKMYLGYSKQRVRIAATCVKTYKKYARDELGLNPALRYYADIEFICNGELRTATLETMGLVEEGSKRHVLVRTSNGHVEWASDAELVIIQKKIAYALNWIGVLLIASAIIQMLLTGKVF